jgi:phytoene dehydrogenase-like protein
MPDFPMLALIFTLGYMHRRNAGFPIGGSLRFSQSIERRYRELGGEIHYKARVTEILVENDRAVGVRLENGEEYRSDIVISAADGHATIFDMLDGKYLDDTVRGYYQKMPIFQPLIQVSLGIARDLSDLPHSITYPLHEPITVAGEAHERITVRNYCYDVSMAPQGKSVVEIYFSSNHAYWRNIAGTEKYEAEKQVIADIVVKVLEDRFPGIGRQIEVVDVATPLTYERYTGNWQGSFEGWFFSSEVMNMHMSGKGMSKTLPGLENFYMVGQWVEPGGGVPPAAKSGRDVIQIICKRDRKQFAADVPTGLATVREEADSSADSRVGGSGLRRAS